MAFRVGEPTLGPRIARIFERTLNCSVAEQGILPGRKSFDFFIFLDNLRIIVELEIGGKERLIEGIVEAEDYRTRINADGSIVICYPEEARKIVSRPEDIDEIALNLFPSAIVLCPFLRDCYSQIPLTTLLLTIKEKLLKPVLAPSMRLVVQGLREAAQGIALEIKRFLGIDHPVVKETLSHFTLFKILAEEEKQLSEEDLKDISADLSAFILINQILLYHLLSKPLGLKKLESITFPIALNGYFKQITDINYRAVYCADIVSYLPEVIIREINNAIMAIHAIKPENISHDLLGRIFHEFLPPKTRKQLGAFFTNPIAAEILAGLSVDKADEKVLDPACGSGTLLTAVYRWKRKLGRPHRKIVEEDLTGIDIMPFASHLTASTLTLQSPTTQTNKMRIGVGNSLMLTVGKEVDSLAKWMEAFGEVVSAIDVDKLRTKGEIFQLEPVDLVIMNPPFTRKERLTPEMKGFYSQIIGEQNYWAYFLVLADQVLKDKGKIATVLSTDFFRGEYSKKIREFLFKQRGYMLSYIVKSAKETAFSERASFRDFLVVLTKGKDKSKCAIVYLMKKLADLTLEDAGRIAEKIRAIKEGEDYKDNAITVIWKEQDEILAKWDDLGELITFTTSASKDIYYFYGKVIERARDKLKKLNQIWPPIKVLRGLEPIPEGLLNAIYVVRPIAKERIERSKLILAQEVQDEIIISIKGLRGSIRVPLYCLKRGLKTASYIPQIDVSYCSDMVITKEFGLLNEISRVVGVRRIDFEYVQNKGKDRFTHLALAYRRNIIAPGTKLFAFFSEEEFIPTKSFYCLKYDKEQSKIFALWLNSSFSIIEMLLSSRETEGSFVGLPEYKVLDLLLPDLKKIEKQTLLDAFEKVKNVQFPELLSQFEHHFEPRKLIDQVVLKVIGFDEKEIEILLSQVYEALAIELKSLQEVMRRSISPEKAKVIQPYLFSIT